LAFTANLTTVSTCQTASKPIIIVYGYKELELVLTMQLPPFPIPLMLWAAQVKHLSTESTQNLMYIQKSHF
jgi:hypothetical protein